LRIATMPGMDTLLSLASLALALLVAVGIGAVIRILAGTEDAPTTLAAIFAPVVALPPTETRPTAPAVREDEPVRWRFGPTDQTHPAAA
jgi:hypothetical protein